MWRRIRQGQALGECLYSVSSIVQGDPLSMMLLNALMTTMFAAIDDVICTCGLTCRSPQFP